MALGQRPPYINLGNVRVTTRDYPYESLLCRGNPLWLPLSIPSPIDGCFVHCAKRISRNLSNIGVSGNRTSFPKQQILALAKVLPYVVEFNLCTFLNTLITHIATLSKTQRFIYEISYLRFNHIWLNLKCGGE